ncbi:MAG: 50S ribosomal protein L5 [Patescibacteria group bacterium]|nr:50S ribosomal protein L5 [Patescibacteria group bacterium]
MQHSAVLTQEQKKKIMDEMKFDNPMMVPKIEKVVLNIGVGEATVNKNAIANAQEQLTLIAGQKAVVTLAKKSISTFKIRKGFPNGVKVTLRGKKMHTFLDKLIRIVIPRIKDFRGINHSAVDPGGNLNLGFSEQTIFPEIEYDKIDKIRGLQVTIVSSARDRDTGKKLFEIIGIPFKKD